MAVVVLFRCDFPGGVAAIDVLLCPRNGFRRPGHLNTDFKRSGDQGEATQSHASLSGASNDERKELSPDSNDATETAIRISEKYSFAQSLRLFNGRKTDESFFKLFLWPFPLFFHPAIFWVSRCSRRCDFTTDMTRHASFKVWLSAGQLLWVLCWPLCF